MWNPRIVQKIRLGNNKHIPLIFLFLLCEEIDFYLSTYSILLGINLFLLIFCALPLFPLLPHSPALVSTLILDDQDSSSSSSFLLWYLLSIPPGGDEKVPIRIKSGLPHSPRKLKNPFKHNFPVKYDIELRLSTGKWFFKSYAAIIVLHVSYNSYCNTRRGTSEHTPFYPFSSLWKPAISAGRWKGERKGVSDPFHDGGRQRRRNFFISRRPSHEKESLTVTVRREKKRRERN